MPSTAPSRRGRRARYRPAVPVAAVSPHCRGPKVGGRYAVVRPGRTLNGDPVPAVYRQCRTLAEAEAAARAAAKVFGHAWVEAWSVTNQARDGETIVARFHGRLLAEVPDAVS
jgi:hypothetical protein